jgi:hypothetical protein
VHLCEICLAVQGNLRRALPEMQADRLVFGRLGLIGHWDHKEPEAFRAPSAPNAAAEHHAISIAAFGNIAPVTPPEHCYHASYTTPLPV